MDRCGVNTLYGQAVVGLCVLKPTANYINSLPIKMFEYMAAGLPFVCSDFPRWKKIADETGAGVCVSVDDINAVHKAIQELLSDRSKAQQMGRRGRMAIEQRYCWSMEEDKLLSLYYDISA